MIFGADAFDKGSCSAVARPFVFSVNIFCPATVPGLKLPVNEFSFQMTTGAATAGDPAPDTAHAPAPAPALAPAILILGWFGSG